MKPSQQASFFFFDYETFGTHPGLDRPCQFAGVRTDENFNIIGKPLVIYCRPSQDYLPQPEACLITGITPQIAIQKGLSEPEFIKEIVTQLSVPNTCSLGYNNIRFDDEVTRYTLYRNFYDPYAWSWQHNNSRWDLLDVMRTAYALRPEHIIWPKNSDGVTSFKLEDLSVANGIEHSNAHDAMADVYATIEMAKRLKAAQPKLFHYFFELRDKNKIKNLIDTAKLTPLVHVSGMFGTDRNNISIIAPIAWHPTNSNAVICIDLAKDLTPLFMLDAKGLKRRLYTKKADLAPDELPVPIKLIHINKCPILAPIKVLTATDEVRLALDKQSCLDKLTHLKANPDICPKLLALFSDDHSIEKTNTNVDTALYSGFFSSSDRAIIEKIRTTAPEHLAAIDLREQDARLAPLLFRFRARNYPHTLTEEESLRWQLHCRDYFESELPDFILKLDTLAELHKDDPKKIKILKSIYQYVQELTH